MKLKECLDFGKMCGLRTIDECIRNVEIHAGMIFHYQKMNEEFEEFEELYKEFKEEYPEEYAKHFQIVEEERTKEERDA